LRSRLLAVGSCALSSCGCLPVRWLCCLAFSFRAAVCLAFPSWSLPGSVALGRAACCVLSGFCILLLRWCRRPRQTKKEAPLPPLVSSPRRIPLGGCGAPLVLPPPLWGGPPLRDSLRCPFLLVSSPPPLVPPYISPRAHPKIGIKIPRSLSILSWPF